MPSKNIIRIFVKDGIYHIYNRRVEKGDIFLDEQDFRIFLYYLKSYLSCPDKKQKAPLNISRLGSEFSLYKEIHLLCYVLMPNHFHFLIQQKSEHAITEFMRRLINAYVKYFNEKYERVGPLFQGRYKAALVSKDEYFLHLSSYIHINPIELSDYSKIKNLENYSYSSYPDYIGKRNTSWVFRDHILDYFQGKDKFASYKEQTEELAFVSDKYKKEKEFKPLLLD
jgi:putative transposase